VLPNGHRNLFFCCSWPIVLDRFFSTDPVNNVVEESIPALVPKAN
jgi:hypothetical protein